MYRIEWLVRLECNNNNNNSLIIMNNNKKDLFRIDLFWCIHVNRCIWPDDVVDLTLSRQVKKYHSLSATYHDQAEEKFLTIMYCNCVRFRSRAEMTDERNEKDLLLSNSNSSKLPLWKFGARNKCHFTLHTAAQITYRGYVYTTSRSPMYFIFLGSWRDPKIHKEIGKILKVS